ncbi:MAG: hypothetical protein ABL961_14015, partial [Vicinamibacterales bacterium]
IMVEGGFESAYEQKYPVSGLQGNLVKVPTVGVSIGVSSIAEMQLDGGFYNRLAIRQRDSAAPLAGLLDVPGTSTSDVDNAVIGMKLRILSERATRPAFGFRFATKLPNAGSANGLGPDTTDFFASVLAAKTKDSVRVVANLGMGILGDATNGSRQNDVLIYGASVARAFTDRAELVGEVNGRVSTRAGKAFPGTETRGLLRLGGRYTRNAIRFDTAAYFGLTPDDPSIGVTLGFTYVFQAFDIP